MRLYYGVIKEQQKNVRINEKIGIDKLNEYTCNPALTGFTAPKILWVRKHLPKIYKKIYKILLPKDYIRFKLTGVFASEVSDASGTLLFDVKNRKWSKEMLNALDIDKNKLPKVYESPVISRIYYICYCKRNRFA